jgi:hypothetical protein
MRVPPDVLAGLRRRVDALECGTSGGQGPKGDPGPAGPEGDTGATGPAGATGPQGQIGPAGPQGAQGPKGDNGPQGVKGDTGLTGPQGTAGPQGASGAAGPQGQTGAQGPQGIQGPAGPAYWTEITLASDYTNALATFATITGMTFTPTANSTFEVQAALLIQTTTTTNLPRVGVSIGAGMAYGAVQIDQTGATDTARVQQDGTFLTTATTVQVPAGGLATANSPRLCYVTIRGKAGASPGAIALQMACETAGASICFVKAGSQMRYKLT